jgi:hypothetical protein
MGNRTLNLVALLILILVVGFVVFSAVKKEAGKMKPMVMSPEELEKLETNALADDDFVIITLTNDRFHIERCPHISGPTEKVIHRVAVDRGAQPCPYCIGDE